MLGLADLIYGVLLPALVAGLLLLAATRGARSEDRPRPLLGALALGLGYLIAHIGILGMPPVPGGEQQLGARDWIAWLVVAAIVLAALRGVARWKRFATPIYIALLCVLLFRYTLGNVLQGGARGVAIRLGLTLTLYFVWTATERLAQRRPGPAVPASLAVTGIGVALSALFAHSFTVAEQAGAICSGLGAAAVVGLLDKRAHLPTGAVAIALLVFAGALVNATIYDLPLSSSGLLAVSVLAPWLGEGRAFERLSLHKKGFLDMALAALPAAIAGYLAWRAGAASETY